MAWGLLVVFLGLVSLGWHARTGHGWRDSLIRSAVIWGSCTAVITELLSAFGALTRAGLGISWSLACVLAGVWAIGSLHRAVHPVRSPSMRIVIAAAGPLLPGCLLLVLLVGLAALMGPPGPGDVQLYHMPRILFWLQQRSVAHYPTANHQQLFQPPWAEFANLHAYALTDGDRLASVVHFASYLGAALAASLAAARLGASLRGQAAAAVFVLTIPEGLLTASGAKNDFSLAFWLIVSAYLALCYVEDNRLTDLVLLGISTGLSILTKGTAYVWAPFLLLACACTHGKAGLLRLLRSAPLICIICLLLNGPHYLRNYRMFGSPLGCSAAHCDGVFRFANSEFGLRTLASNLARNLALHATTPVPQLNGAVYRGVLVFLRLINADPNDPRNTWPGERFRIPEFSAHEALAGNPLHLLIGLGVVIALLWRGGANARRMLVFGLGLALSFVAFCWLLRWQPWHTRLHLPFFVSLGALVGAGLNVLRCRWMGTGLAVLMLMCALPFALLNAVRPMVPPNDSVFVVARDAMYRAPEQTRILAQVLRSHPCRRLALDATSYFAAYPLLHWLGVGLSDINVVYLSHDSRFARWFQEHPPAPCTVIYTHCSESPARAARCRELGPGVSFGELFVVTGFDATWAPGRGWQVRKPAAQLLRAYGADLGEVAELPVKLRADDAGHRKLLKGLPADRWVTHAGIRIPVAHKGASALSVRVSGEVPPWSKLAPLDLVLRCGEGPSRSLRLQRTGDFSVSVEVPCAGGENAELEIVPSRTFRPVDLGINQDPRRLSFSLRAVEIERRGGPR